MSELESYPMLHEWNRLELLKWDWYFTYRLAYIWMHAVRNSDLSQTTFDGCLAKLRLNHFISKILVISNMLGYA